MYFTLLMPPLNSQTKGILHS